MALALQPTRKLRRLHFSVRPDVVRLRYMKSAEPSLAELAVEALEKKSPDEIEAIAERQGLGRTIPFGFAALRRPSPRWPSQI